MSDRHKEGRRRSLSPLSPVALITERLSPAGRSTVSPHDITEPSDTARHEEEPRRWHIHPP